MHLRPLSFRMLGLPTSSEDGVLALKLLHERHPKSLKNIINLFGSGFGSTSKLSTSKLLGTRSDHYKYRTILPE